ncbi:uncharacterized protein F4822DRAFT_129772 [Hypoxylon trugodes]|uniref:uncharacterized protein n=1 Tax=Hypoxylon trugodes TaxID=326681 RepID=UPI00219838BE|nr:uncharacterized protein F4822DRAFT_129772 [Hypoxylon trugodes]KAI1392454.1 hypothetical protein F4822DRAFT_129772 [Hypoxylon trugodes]
MEVVGVAASSITLLEVVTKVATGALKLKKLWDEVHDVPDMVLDLMREPDAIYSVLNEIATGLENDCIAHQIPQHCQGAVDDLDDVVRDLSAHLNSSKRHTRTQVRIKVVIKKDMLGKSQERLQRAISLLNLAQQSYMLAFVKHQPVVIVESMMKAMTSNSQPLRLPSSQTALQGKQVRFKTGSGQCIAPHPSTVTASDIVERQTNRRLNAPWTYATMGLLAWRYAKEQPEDNSNLKTGNSPGYDFRIQFPRWFINRAWDFHASKAMQGWTYLLKPWRIRPHEDPVFEAAIEGEIDVIEALIRTNKASLWDRPRSGLTLLHLASIHYKTTNRLVHWGLDINEPGAVYLPLQLAVTNFDPTELSEKELHDHLLQHNAYEEDGPLLPFMREQSAFYRRFLLSSTWSSKLFKALQPRLLPDHYELPLVDRLMRIQFPDSDADPISICLFLRKDGTLHQEDVSELQRKGICLLNVIAICYGRNSIHNQNDWFYITARSRELVREVVPMTDSLSFTCMPMCVEREEFEPAFLPCTALFHLLYGFTKHNWPFNRRTGIIRKMKTMFRYWLEDLSSCGVDLQSYGRMEKAIFKENNLKAIFWRCSWYSDMVNFRLDSFQYGSTPGDWKSFWDFDIERFAGDFWALVEMPRYPMPGSWVDDDE